MKKREKFFTANAGANPHLFCCQRNTLSPKSLAKTFLNIP